MLVRRENFDTSMCDRKLSKTVVSRILSLTFSKQQIIFFFPEDKNNPRSQGFNKPGTRRIFTRTKTSTRAPIETSILCPLSTTQ